MFQKQKPASSKLSINIFLHLPMEHKVKNETLSNFEKFYLF